MRLSGWAGAHEAGEGRGKRRRRKSKNAVVHHQHLVGCARRARALYCWECMEPACELFRPAVQLAVCSRRHRLPPRVLYQAAIGHVLAESGTSVSLPIQTVYLSFTGWRDSGCESAKQSRSDLVSSLAARHSNQHRSPVENATCDRLPRPLSQLRIRSSSSYRMGALQRRPEGKSCCESPAAALNSLNQVCTPSLSQCTPLLSVSFILLADGSLS